MESHVVRDAGRRRSSSRGELNQPVSAAVVGQGIGALAAELAAKKLEKVYAVEHELLKDYTPDGYTAALAAAHRAGASRTSCCFPHTYQVRDFAPKLATRFDRVLVSDVVVAPHRGRQAGAGAAALPGQDQRRT